MSKDRQNLISCIMYLMRDVFTSSELVQFKDFIEEIMKEKEELVKYN